MQITRWIAASEVVVGDELENREERLGIGHDTLWVTVTRIRKEGSRLLFQTTQGEMRKRAAGMVMVRRIERDGL